MRYDYAYHTCPIEDRIEELYRSCGVRCPSDVTLYIWDAAVRVMVVHRPGISDAALILDTYVIFVDSHLSLPERREVIAHEIGHALQHGGNQTAMSQVERAKQEYQAIRFSYFSLVPTYLLRDYQPEENETHAGYVTRLAELFCVPVPFLHRRLELLTSQSRTRTQAMVAEDVYHYGKRLTE